MKYIFSILTILLIVSFTGAETVTYRKLNREEEAVIIHKGTEAPFSGSLLNNKKQGTYHCRQCDLPLYRSSDKFDSQCGWPSFDDEIKDAVTRLADPDGRRTEIICSRCRGHLGHVFLNEGFTAKNTRHCVNSISMIFREKKKQLGTAYFAAGCFWGVEFLFEQEPGVIAAESGYMGGSSKSPPSYHDVCSGKTGHAETVKIIYDAEQISFEQLVRIFFEIHDFTQLNRQGPDIGTQYRSAVFINNNDEKKSVTKLLKILKNKGFDPATTIENASDFWPAEKYHQNYYTKNGKTPYCHFRKKIF